MLPVQAAVIKVEAGPNIAANVVAHDIVPPPANKVARHGVLANIVLYQVTALFIIYIDRLHTGRHVCGGVGVSVVSVCDDGVGWDWIVVYRACTHLG